MRRATGGRYARPVCALAMVFLCAARAFPQSMDERAVRAAYVFNLAKEIEWPADKNELVIGYFGSQEKGEFLERILDGRIANSRSIHLILFPADTDLKNCNMLYIGDSENQFRRVLERTGHLDVVTVGESDSFLHNGGMIGLVKLGDSIQMHINLELVQQTGVKLGARLLNSAATKAFGGAAQRSGRKAVQHEEPEYPTIAAKMGLHGMVRIKVTVAGNGKVLDAQCLGGHPVLADSALKTVRNWRFEASPTQSTEVVEFTF